MISQKADENDMLRLYHERNQKMRANNQLMESTIMQMCQGMQAQSLAGLDGVDRLTRQLCPGFM